jgi:hypothetical protein
VDRNRATTLEPLLGKYYGSVDSTTPSTVHIDTGLQDGFLITFEIGMNRRKGNENGITTI